MLNREKPINHNLYRFAYALAAVGSVASQPAQAGVAVTWTRQIGTAADDESFGVSADGLGNVYLTGRTQGSLGGPSAGSFDGFVSKYDAAGALQWTRQIGTGSDDYGLSVSADGLGSVYISGYTYGSLGGPNVGAADAFVTKYDSVGVFQWTQQLGTDAFDYGEAVSADGLGNVFISGWTGGSLGGPSAGNFDAFVSKYDAAGISQWTRQLGTASLDAITDISADSLGNVYISGDTAGSLGGPNIGGFDIFVSKYNTGGALQWTKQLGTANNDQSYGVSADGLGNVYLTGSTEDGSFVSEYDAAGVLQWTQQLGAVGNGGVSADGLGNVYISGWTDGSVAGDVDAFVSKYDAAGVFQWIKQLGTAAVESSTGVSADGLGNIYISGDTYGSLAGPNAGRVDAFVSKIAEVGVPEPSTGAIAFMLSVFGLYVAGRPHRAVSLNRS